MCCWKESRQCSYGTRFLPLHLSFAWHNLEVLKASILREKFSCKGAFKMLGTHGFLQYHAALVEKTKCLLCCAHGFRLDLSANSWNMFFLSSVFIYAEVKYLLTSQKYFHMLLMKLKCGVGSSVFLWFCVRSCVWVRIITTCSFETGKTWWWMSAFWYFFSYRIAHIISKEIILLSPLTENSTFCLVFFLPLTLQVQEGTHCCTLNDVIGKTKCFKHFFM